MTDPRVYQEGHHWIGDLNFDPELVATRRFPQPLTIYDSTIRKILLTPGLWPTPDRMLRVAEALETVGIHQMLLNLFWWGEPRPERMHLEVVRAILARGFAFHSAVYVSLGNDISGAGASLRDAVQVVREAGADEIEIAVPVPRTSEGLAQALERVDEAAELARSAGLRLALGLQDLPRKSFDAAVVMANRGIALGAVRLGLTDSYSSLSPEALRLWSSRFRARLSAPIEASMHAHNDFGMGTTLAIAAALGGIQPEVSANNFSYRGGFATLDEVAVALDVLYAVPTGIRLEKLCWLAETVATEAGLPQHPIKPITGRHVFVRDQPASMIQQLERGADSFPPSGSCLAPSVVGGRMVLVWGEHHSSGALRVKLRHLGLPADDATISEVQRRIERRLDEIAGYPRWLSESDVDGICRQAAAGSGAR